MKTISAAEAKQHFGAYVEQALSEPIVVEHSGQRSAVLMDYAEFQRLKAFEENYWLEKAVAAHAAGFLNAEENEAWQNRMRNRFDAAT